MKKGKSSRDLKEKVLFLMCLGVLAGNISTGVYGEILQDETKTYNRVDYTEDEILGDSLIIKNTGTKDGIQVINQSQEEKFTVNFNNDVEIQTEGGNGIYVESRHAKEFSLGTAKATFNNNLKVTVTNTLADGYALYTSANASSAASTASLIINEEKKKENIIQITGDIYAEAYGFSATNQNPPRPAKSEIKLNLSNSDSFFAGKMKTSEYKEENRVPITNASIEMNLENGGTWYAQDSDGSDSYTIDGSDTNLRTTITSNGGIIDIYNYAPNQTRTGYFDEQIKIFESEKTELKTELNTFQDYLKQAEDAKNAGTITEEVFNQIAEALNTEIADIESYINDVEKDIKEAEEKKEKGKLGNRTFTLKNVGDRLQDTTFRISTDIENKKSDLIKLEGVDTTSGSQTYFVQIAADPFSKGEWELQPGDKIQVMDITGTGLENIEVEGKEYKTSIAGGLIKQMITPTIEESDGNGTGKWYLTAVDKTEGKGDGHEFAELGAALNAGMAAAWRADNSDLYQRMGNLRNKEAEQGVWGRIYTGENEVRKGMDLDLEYRAV